MTSRSDETSRNESSTGRGRFLSVRDRFAWPDSVLAGIPLTFASGFVFSFTPAVPTLAGVVAAALVSAGVVGYCLFVDPPLEDG